jgi:hypothetical protein
LANGGAPLGIGTLMVGGVSPLTNGDNVGWTGTDALIDGPPENLASFLHHDYDSENNKNYIDV